jgi:hypothetical protein
MEEDTSDGGGDAIAGLIVGDGNGRYFAIAWDEVRRYRVPAAWVASVEALVRGAEPICSANDLRGHADARTQFTDHALLIEAIAEPGGLRLAAQRLEAWVLLR